jgi:uncharacterized Zn-binding protein involved in type VI secretion
MAGEIIRLGDKTSHDGTVVEGSLTDICMGKPIAYIGHQTYCPKCKGNYPIIEGVLTTTFYGEGVAVAGMKTACGAVLLASQFTDVVECGSGTSASSSVTAQKRADAATARAAQAIPSHNAAQSGSEDDEIEIEHFYSLVGEDGKPVDAYCYDLRMADVLHTKAGIYTDGETVKITGAGQSCLITWLDRDGGLRG